MRIVFLFLLMAACSSAEQLEVTLEGESAQRFLRFYFGSYASEDPYEAGLLNERGGRFYVDLTVLRKYSPELAQELKAKASGGVVSPDSLRTAVQMTYYLARDLPERLSEFNDQWVIDNATTFEVHGPVTNYLRRITLSESALQGAIWNYYENGEKIRYAVGTAIKAEHLRGTRVVETTAMVRRSDGFWDFATYDSTGALTSHTLPNDRALATPTQCAGCHFGNKGFEPEQSWPQEPAKAPGDIRKWYTGPRDIEVAEFFSEHFRRSDTLLGLYATAYVSNLRAQRREGTLDSSAIALLNHLGL
ncbi:MAG: hypothetical protein F4058_03755 [Rhodothermaceae bacterium]|nr:hypothetical protein [Rhodothermaceae bacterium]MYF63636.1 hypothetical protein [Rhodothermaceae bacterium]MYI84433.1 hypothetical protein [Rhodothermaceae bacterium]